MPEAVATILGITQQPGKSVSDSLASAFEGRARLLIFDNCEHVLDAAADLIEKILVQSTSTTVLATSREGLQLSGERLWPLPPLDIQTGEESAAATLFRERAEAAAPGTSSDGDTATIVEICRRLDGIPLAIELAASRMVSMTLTELRERLNDRFHLLVGARRRMERHQTLHHAVQWSYDLLDDAEKALLQRCSVFVGGFDHDAAHALSGSSSPHVTSDLLDSLVRKSLVIANRRGKRTRFSMLETIRQFAEEKLREASALDAVHDLHARYFAAREADLLALWDSPQQRDAYAWLSRELPNLRAAFRWAADHGDFDSAATIASYAAFVGYWLEQYEPVAWVEELIESARTASHPRLTQLYTLAAHCFITGRVDDAIVYINAAENAIASGTYADLLPGLETWFGGAYIAAGDPRRWADQCRMSLVRRPNGNITARAMLVLALNITGPPDDIRSSAAGLLDAADATDNPQLACVALLAAGIAERRADPVAAQAILERGQAIALDSDNHLMWAHMSTTLSRLTATYGEPVDALGHLASAIRNFRDSGSFSLMFSPLAILTALFDRMGQYDPAATISGFAATEWTRQANREFAPAVEHIRDVLGDEAFERLARAGRSMSDGAMATYALEQIDLAHADLRAESP